MTGGALGNGGGFVAAAPVSIDCAWFSFTYLSSNRVSRVPIVLLKHGNSNDRCYAVGIRGQIVHVERAS